jgi:hypothetical protein
MDNISYFSRIFKRLSNREIFCNLQIDEIYLDQVISLANGCLSGAAACTENVGEIAKRAQVYLLESLRGNIPTGIPREN